MSEDEIEALKARILASGAQHAEWLKQAAIEEQLREEAYQRSERRMDRVERMLISCLQAAKKEDRESRAAQKRVANTDTDAK